MVKVFRIVTGLIVALTLLFVVVGIGTSYGMEDLTPPLIYGEQPTGVIFIADIPLSMMYEDPEPSSGIASVEMYLNDVKLDESICVWSSTEVDCQVTGLGFGNYTVRGVVIDAAGNVDQDYWYFSVYNYDPPVITGVYPTGTIGVSGTTVGMDYTLALAENAYVGYAKLLLDGNNITADCSLLVTGASCPVVGLENGYHWVYGMIYNNVGLSSEIDWTFNVDVIQLPLSLSLNNIYWDSYQSYLERVLTVRYGITNTGQDTAYNFTITGSNNTNGVIAAGIPVIVGDIVPGAQVNSDVLYNLPPGVSRFRTNVTAEATDEHSITHHYPGDIPG